MLGDFQVDLCVRASEQRACRIVHVYFNQQGAGGHVDGIGGAHQFSLKGAARKLGQTEIRRHADLNPLRIFLWDVYVDAQSSGLSDVEEIGFYIGIAAGVDQVSNVSVSRGDDAVERSVNLFKGHQCRVLVYRCLVCLDNGFVRIVSTDGIISVLLGDSVAFQKSQISGFCDRSEFEICLRGCQVAAGLLELLVDFRSFDDGKQLALLDTRSNIDVPLFQIPVSAGINGRCGEWLYISRKDDLLGGRSLFWRNNRYWGEGDLRRFRLQNRAGPDTGPDARDQQGGDGDQRNRQAQPSSVRTLLSLRIVRWKRLPANLFSLLSFL